MGCNLLCLVVSGIFYTVISTTRRRALQRMDYFSKFLKSSSSTAPKVEVDHAAEFHRSWVLVKNTLENPDERQISRGIKATDVPAHLQSMVDALVWESTRIEEGGTGACLEYLLKNDVLGLLVKLSEADRPFGIQAEVLRSVQNMVVLMDEQFLVHSAVHKAVLRLLRNCVGDDIHERLDGRDRMMGAAGNVTRTQPSEYEEDLVNLLCILCSRIRNYRDLLMIFFHDKQWYRPEPLFSVEEEDEEEEDQEEEEEDETEGDDEDATIKLDLSSQPVSTSESANQPVSQLAPETTAPSSSTAEAKKPEYEFLLFDYLLRFVHREGQIGDFARAGLLFLMDIAMSPGDSTTESGALSLSTSTSSVSAMEKDSNVEAAIALAEYILDGDFADVLAAGLAAVYSLLPTKLEITPPRTEVPQGSAMVLGRSVAELSEDGKEKLELEREKNRELGVEESSNPDFKGRLHHFLKLLEFLKDILRRNDTLSSSDSYDASALVGSAIVQSILDAVRRVFFENVLYPSILECSDTDGSAVAVMSYIEITVRTLEGAQLGDVLVEFLLSDDNSEEFTRSRMRPHGLLNLNGPPIRSQRSPIDRSTRLRRRKSSAMVLLEMEAPDTRRPSEYFTSMGRFTLKDLILSSLKSPSHPTVTAALQLVETILTQFCRVSVEKLLVVVPDLHATSFPVPSMLLPPEEFANPVSPLDDDEDGETFVYPGADVDTNPDKPTLPVVSFVQPSTTFWTHEREMGLYLALISRVDPSHQEDVFSTGYEHYLRDALYSLQSHQCYHWDVDEDTRGKSKHRLSLSDPILSLVLDSLRKFFSNTAELNMALTGLLATLALCPDRSLAGWLTFFPKEDGAHDQGSDPASVFDFDGDDRSIDFAIGEKLASDSHSLPASSMDENTRPVVHSVFHGLVAQLERYRLLVDDFDKYLLERRQGLVFSENLTDALSLALELDTQTLVPSKSSVSNIPAPGNEPTTPKSKSKPKASSFVSFLTPKKKAAKSQPVEQPPTSSRGNKALDASPFGSHYQKTSSIVVESFDAPIPTSGPWTPAKPMKWGADEEDVFASSGQWGGDTSVDHYEEEVEEEEQTTKTITLSRLLDNVVILEEAIKELVAIIHARRSLGIDSVRYL